jgi:nitrous oxidase accessory protein
MNTKRTFMFLLILLLPIAGCCYTETKAGKVWTVDDDGPADFQSIQEAVDAADSGDTVFVHNGIYLEYVSINKSISLVGENPFNTIIDARWGHAVLVQADNVTVKNLTVCNTAPSAFSYYLGGGIFLNYSNSCNIENCIVVKNSHGINLYHSNYSNISHNLLMNNWLAIVLWNHSSNDTIIGNWILNNSYNGHNIFIGTSSKNITVVENYLWDNPLTIDGIDPAYTLVSPASCVVAQNNFMQNARIDILYDLGDWQPRPDVAWSKDGQGNFWIEYSGSDANEDGVGDTPYVIDGVNNDSLPLMNPFKWLQGDINYDMKVNIVDITLIARAYGSQFGDSDWNPRYDLNNDKSINILDIAVAAANFDEQMTWQPA